MKSLSKVITSISLMGSAMLLTACGAKEAKQVEANETKVKSIVMVTDANGVDDKSFNQSAWEGLVDWGKETGAKKGTTGYDYIQSNDASEFTTNIDQALTAEFNTIAGVGFLIRDAIETVATQHPRQQFAIIDSVIEGKNNVVSATFRDGEVAYLAGIAAAYTTTTNHVGFIGGEEGAIIDRFEVGFKKGVQDAAEALNKSVKVDVKYAASFADPAKGKILAARIYQDGADIIYHASGGTGAGVFQEAKALNESSTDKKVWVIGADKDQTEDGHYKNKFGKADNLTLTSAVKRVGSALKDIANKANDGEFPGGEHLEYGLSNDGLELIDGNMDDKTIKAVEQAKDKIITGDLTVPNKK